MDKYENVFQTQGLLDLKKCLASIEEKPKKNGNLRVVAQYNPDYMDDWDAPNEDISWAEDDSEVDESKFSYDPMRCKMCDDGSRYEIVDTSVDSDGETVFKVKCQKCQSPEWVYPEQITSFNSDSESDKIAKMISKYTKFAQSKYPDYMDDWDPHEYDPEDIPDFEEDLEIDQAVNPGYEPVGFEGDPFVDEELSDEYDQYLEEINNNPDLETDHLSEGPDANIEDEEYLETENNFKDIMRKYIE